MPEHAYWQHLSVEKTDHREIITSRHRLPKVGYLYRVMVRDYSGEQEVSAAVSLTFVPDPSGALAR